MLLIDDKYTNKTLITPCDYKLMVSCGIAFYKKYENIIKNLIIIKIKYLFLI